MLSHSLRASVNNATIPPVIDPKFKQVSLLLHGDGTNGAQNNTFLDSSTNNFTVTRNGTPTQGTNTPFSQADGYWSNYLNGSSYFTTPTNAALDFSTGYFTIEFWMNPTDVVGNQHTLYNGNWSIQFYTGGCLIFYDGAVRYFTPTGTSATTLSQWNHVALSRSGGTLKGFYNGVQQFSYASSTAFNFSTATIGFRSGYAGYSGYLSNYRFIKGTGIYTANFTPSTTPLTAVTNTSFLICQSNYFKDNSSNNFTVTPSGTPSVQPFSPFAPTSAYSTSVNGGSSYHNGPNTGSYLTVAGGASLGSGSFTIEGWIYPQAYNTGFFNTITGTTPSGSGELYIGYFSATQLYMNSGATGLTGAKTVSMPLPLNVWQHIAIVKNGTTLTVYINGISTLSGSDTYTYTNPNMLIGGWYDATGTLLGYISNFRVVKGTAVYTSNFTPPTAPFTAITNTSLLLSGTNAGIYDNAMENDVTTVGSTQVSTSVVKYGTGSMKFNGTTDYLTIPYTPQYNFGTSNWTVECWVNATSLSGGTICALNDFNNGGYASIRPQINTDGSMYLLCASANPGWINTSTTATGLISTGTWYHIAAVRNGSTFTLYINGTSQLTYTSSSALFSTGTYSHIGCVFSGSSASGFFTGYIDDFRVTNGVARYTANFTPPTQAFPNQ